MKPINNNNNNKCSKPGVVAHAYNLSIQEVQKFESSLAYMKP